MVVDIIAETWGEGPEVEEAGGFSEVRRRAGEDGQVLWAKPSRRTTVNQREHNFTGGCDGDVVRRTLDRPVSN